MEITEALQQLAQCADPILPVVSGYLNSAEQVPAQWTVCGGQAAELEVGEAMISEVLRTAGLVEPVEPDNCLARHDGIGALLRLPSSTVPPA